MSHYACRARCLTPHALDPMDNKIGCRNIGKEHHGYSDTHSVLHVVHNHKWRHLDSVGSVLRVRPGFSVSHAKQMVSHSTRNLQRGHLFVPRVVQSLLSGLQCRSLRGLADHRIRRSIQQEHPGIRRKNGISIIPDRRIKIFGRQNQN